MKGRQIFYSHKDEQLSKANLNVRYQTEIVFAETKNNC